MFGTSSSEKLEKVRAESPAKKGHSSSAPRLVSWSEDQARSSQLQFCTPGRDMNVKATAKMWDSLAKLVELRCIAYDFATTNQAINMTQIPV